MRQLGVGFGHFAGENVANAVCRAQAAGLGGGLNLQAMSAAWTWAVTRLFVWSWRVPGSWTLATTRQRIRSLCFNF